MIILTYILQKKREIFYYILSKCFVEVTIRSYTGKHSFSPSSPNKIFFSVSGLFNRLTVKMNRQKTASCFSVCYNKLRIFSDLSANCRPCSLASVQLEGMITVEHVLALQQFSSHGVGANSITTAFFAFASLVNATESGLLERCFLKMLLVSNIAVYKKMYKSISS